ncbi:tRNA (adenosine(37)-N6)-dimethylallyltransferase MiaA [Lewinella sp. JB7]|uniref:tRNA (adenosine(37)-N6)-dimethylallyltransferase MiaA n=1 Tax=Lewinella sp. JB7 TaxID=2962887 RepID=UPI0020C94E91|nr:tRNA (adenosine(37)-N6)-dimethylallyltransferase MiaA [Lewinella sp. JB7]MCP9237570.1 tRNA (adenosine(37)-N6)-dimethylallyltransferase MiaA [Lewinella sp. JB7]
MGKRVLVIGGPTASGKTRLAIEVARHYGTEIVSADSRQFYREMRIGNARPTPEELSTVPHHFIADRSLTSPLSAGRYAAEARNRLDGIFCNHDIAVVVGGSGLFIRALCGGLDEFPEVSENARRRVMEIESRDGLEGLRTALAQHDPAYYDRVDRHNGRRLQRALRVCFTEGKPYSSYLGNAAAPDFSPHYFCRSPARDELYARIERRVDQMINEGLEAEARQLLPHQDLPVLRTVGYQEWWPYFAGDYGKDRAIELIKRNSRRYAKRQYTWFRDYASVASVRDIQDKLG